MLCLIVSLFASHQRVNYLFSFDSIIWLIVLIPLMLYYKYEYSEIDVMLKISRIVRFINISWAYDIFVVSMGYQAKVGPTTIKIFLLVITLLFVTACLILTFEQPKRKDLIAERIRQNAASKISMRFLSDRPEFSEVRVGAGSRA